jgi:uncharacterized repeat protein (TIGR01451 family)
MPCADLSHVDSGHPECGDVAAPHLMVAKDIPARAQVGDRVPITITVRNVGRPTATEVRLHETPPAGGRIVGVSDGGAIQSDGTAVWSLGNLAPGATRTVRAT